MKPYANYKDSGVDWVKDFPFHWDLLKSKYIYEKKSLSPQENDGVVTCFRDGEVTLRANRRLSGFTEADKEHGYQHVDIGDLVIHGMDAFAGAVGVSDSSGKMSPVCNICQAKIDVNNIYYGYIVKEMAIRGYILSLYRGIRERSSDFRFETFSRQYLPLPPKKEQDEIVAFINEKTKAIDTLSTDKENLLTLLAEERQAIISEAVTKGLDPHAEMKDSGVEWIGEIPVGWGVTKLSRLVSFHNGDRGVNYPSGEDIVDEGIPFLTATTLQNRKVNIEESSFITQERYDLLGGLKIEENDIIYCLRGSTIGKNGIARFRKGTVASSLMGIRVKKIKHDFLLYILNSPIEETQRKYVINGSAAPNLSAENVGQFLVLSPPLEVQEQIVQYLDEKTSKIDQITADTKEQIKLLKEYRQSLISEVVTGKVEV